MLIEQIKTHFPIEMREEDFWEEVCIDGVYYDCNCFSLSSRDRVVPGKTVMVIVYGTYDHPNGHRETDTRKWVGEFML